MVKRRAAPFVFDTNGLYIILTDMGIETLYHWGLYLAQSSRNGLIFHMINSPITGGKWEYQSKPNDGTPYSKTLLVAVKIAVIDVDLHQPLADTLAEVPVDPPINCRVWLHRALHEIHQRGFVQLNQPILDIENEASDLAFKNKTHNEQSVERSAGGDF